MAIENPGCVNVLAFVMRVMAFVEVGTDMVESVEVEKEVELQQS